MTGIIGKKIGMTQRFTDDGTVVPLTVVKAGPCVVVHLKTEDRDGYRAVQLGFVEAGKKANRPMEGHFKRAGIAPCRVLREFNVAPGSEVKVGDSIKASVFHASDTVNVTGLSKGKGFAGVMKRHGFGGGKASHGSMFHRAPGSIGQSAYPSRVLPGMRAPGQMGNARVTVRNLEVVDVIEDEDLILIKGAVPGANGSYVEIVKAATAAASEAEEKSGDA
jgi:large subunit ribosomal protein L3